MMWMQGLLTRLIGYFGCFVELLCLTLGLLLFLFIFRDLCAIKICFFLGRDIHRQLH